MLFRDQQKRPSPDDSFAMSSDPTILRTSGSGHLFLNKRCLSEASPVTIRTRQIRTPGSFGHAPATDIEEEKES
jgi:hypothetical protein